MSVRLSLLEIYLERIAELEGKGDPAHPDFRLPMIFDAVRDLLADLEAFPPHPDPPH